ncbi:SDR family NAD(P)-dependent oxidoreductase [Actinomycetospora lutea]|uniref:SDR family NAD(P)-dependent oxidoreductase n=1 Tax=Actinomycetospora lutea TaxID=663604 RepID=UPI002366B1C7|nr:SDR family NAD(P)-dependent oxidoreductase [Actinomycetospora lutea]MDD7939110.1 SDR family NAD(P)-dependent oxidoreductase [Actinomycetospora lutea]
MTPERMTPGRVCLVTGAGSGIGAAVAGRLAARGHRVATAARSRDALDAVAASIRATTPQAEVLPVTADVTDDGDVEAMYRAVEDRWGPVEVLVAAAGTGFGKALVDTTDEEWRGALELNLTAPFRCLRRALPAMLERRWGRVVVIASVVAKRGEAQVAAYTASKHGVLGLVRSAAAELAATGVTVNAICPGYVDTPMTDHTVRAISARSGRTLAEARDTLARRQPIGRLITTDEVADAVGFCVENGAVTGQGINVDGGAVQS